MSSFFLPDAPFSRDDLEMRIIDGPPPVGFDCGVEEQNAFLYCRAWKDHCRGVTVTYLLFAKGILAAYVTLMTDRIRLGPRERAKGLSYQIVPAIKIAQLAVSRPFATFGLGRYLVGYAVETARTLRGLVGCRYVTLDAEREELVDWYERQGFVRNLLEQEQRREEASRRSRDPDRIAISMRFDLRDAREEG
jgi:GNAT superfamily N-acetyltransferase